MRANLEKRVHNIETQMHVRVWPNRPLTEEEEAYLREIEQEEAEELQGNKKGD